MSYLPSMEPETQQREKIRRTTRATSIGQYPVARDTLEAARESEALKLIAWFWNRYQSTPTIGELAFWMLEREGVRGIAADSWQFMGARLWLARGVSGLVKRGVVESVPKGARKCSQTGVTVETWRVIPAGRRR